MQFNTRSPNSDGRGGVGLYINDDLQFEKKTDISIFIEHVFESIFVEIRTGAKETLIIGIIYRPNTEPKADIRCFYPCTNQIKWHNLI